MAWSSNEQVSNTDTNLKHVYFFIEPAVTEINDENSTASVSNTSVKASRSRTPSPGSNDNDSASFTTASTSRSDMNPLAKEFTPSPKKPPAPSTPTKPSTNLLYELRLTPDKGLGLFATSFIKCGTLIFSERPLLKVDGSSLHHAWGPYCRLSNAQKAVYDGLCLFHPIGLDLDHVARTCLIDYSDPSLDKDDIDEMVIEQVRVMSIFAANAYSIVSGGAAAYATASRLNHSCVPNVHHSYNPTLREVTVYAARDIGAEEELLTTYLGGPAAYQSAVERRDALCKRYGFTCFCPACSDPTGHSIGRRELMACISWGLNEFNSGRLSANNFVPNNTEQALRQSEDLISIMLAEGILTVELMKAYRQASTHSLSLYNFELALEYASNEADVERNCLGSVLNDLKKVGTASECWFDQIHEAMRKYGMEGVPEAVGSVSKKEKTKRKVHRKNRVKRMEAAKRRDTSQGEGQDSEEKDEAVTDKY